VHPHSYFVCPSACALPEPRDVARTTRQRVSLSLSCPLRALHALHALLFHPSLASLSASRSRLLLAALFLLVRLAPPSTFPSQWIVALLIKPRLTFCSCADRPNPSTDISPRAGCSLTRLAPLTALASRAQSEMPSPFPETFHIVLRTIFRMFSTLFALDVMLSSSRLLS